MSKRCSFIVFPLLRAWLQLLLQPCPSARPGRGGASEIDAGGAGAQAQRGATAVSISLAGREGQRPSPSPELRPAGRGKTSSGMEAEGRNRARARFTTAWPVVRLARDRTAASLERHENGSTGCRLSPKSGKYGPLGGESPQEGSAETVTRMI